MRKYYVEWDLDGNEHAREVKENADINAIKEYAHDRIKSGIIKAYKFEHRVCDKDIEIRNKKRKEYIKTAYAKVYCYIPKEKYSLLKERIGDKSVSAYMREKVLEIIEKEP